MKNNFKELKKKTVSYGDLLALAERTARNRESLIRLSDVEAFEAELGSITDNVIEGIGFKIAVNADFILLKKRLPTTDECGVFLQGFVAGYRYRTHEVLGKVEGGG